MVYFCFIHSFCRSPFYEYYSCQVVAVVSYRTGTMCQIQKPKLFCICLSICCDCLQIDCLRGWCCLHVVVVVVVVVDTRCILCTFAVYCCVFLTVMCWTPFSDCKSANYRVNMSEAHMSSVKKYTIQPDALTFLPFQHCDPFFELFESYGR